MASPLVVAIVNVMMAQPAWSGDAWMGESARRQLYEPVAQAIADASTDSADIAVLITLGWHEGAQFARYVIEGRCNDGPPGARCDDGMARTPWQVWHWCKAAWDAPDGSRASLAAGAKCALQMLSWGRSACEAKGVQAGWLSAFAGYRSRACDVLDAPKRLITMRKVSRELSIELAKR